MISEEMKPLVKILEVLMATHEVEENFVQCGRWRLEYYHGEWYVWDWKKRTLEAYPYWGKDLDKAVDKFVELIEKEKRNEI